MRLQYQKSTGAWTDCVDGTTYGPYGPFAGAADWQDKTDLFLELCMKHTFSGDRPLTRDEAVAALEAGKELRYDSSDWYSNCRDGEAYDRKVAARKAKAEAAKDWPEGRKLSCGHVVYYSSQVMSASRGSSCADCYDRMSD